MPRKKGDSKIVLILNQFFFNPKFTIVNDEMKNKIRDSKGLKVDKNGKMTPR